jgi:hypothetical protein
MMLVQGLPVPSGQLENGAASSGEGGVPLRGAVLKRAFGVKGRHPVGQNGNPG